MIQFSGSGYRASCWMASTLTAADRSALIRAASASTMGLAVTGSNSNDTPLARTIPRSELSSAALMIFIHRTFRCYR